MKETAIKLLEYDKIKEKLAEYAVSDQAKGVIKELKPSTDINIIEGWLHETTEGCMIMDRCSSVPLYSLTGIDKVVSKLDKGGILYPEELSAILELLESVRRIRKFMIPMQDIAPGVSSYALSMHELKDLAEEISNSIEYDMVSDKASPELNKIRKKIAITDDRIRQKLNSLLNSSAYAAYIQEAFVSMRNGRYVIPVKKEYRKNIEGSVLDTSASGSTLFIEPASVKKLHEELNMLKLEEENEVYKILSFLTGIVESYKRELSINIEAMIHYDFVFAKAKFSKSLDCREVKLNTKNHISIHSGRHPLIGKDAVPIDFLIGDDYRALVITGPNTGGKTVALKTVGLMTMMVQSGLHVSVGSGSEFAVFEDILVDIGDGQSIEQSLSTFSSHIKNISAILECADSGALVIIDELGSGTDPSEGVGLAAAILEEIYDIGATIIATTHYSEIKSFAAAKDGFENGCMEFDIETLSPMYKLNIGKAGESNALLIALRLGISRNIVERAHEITYKEKKDYSNIYKEPDAKNANAKSFIKPRIQQAAKCTESICGKKEDQEQKAKKTFQIGDCVYISSMGRTGIVCESENSKGELGVMVMKKKLKVNKKRLSLYIQGDELYPKDYDFDIVFETKENRKKRHILSRKHVEGLEITVPNKE